MTRDVTICHLGNPVASFCCQELPLLAARGITEYFFSPSEISSTRLDCRYLQALATMYRQPPVPSPFGNNGCRWNQKANNLHSIPRSTAPPRNAANRIQRLQLNSRVGEPWSCTFHDCICCVQCQRLACGPVHADDPPILR